MYFIDRGGPPPLINVQVGSNTVFYGVFHTPFAEPQNRGKHGANTLFRGMGYENCLFICDFCVFHTGGGGLVNVQVG